MSVRQFEFQLSVIRARIHTAALDIEQSFQEVLSVPVDADADVIREAVKRIKASSASIIKFSTLMETRQKDTKRMMGTGITVATKLFHHSEIVCGAVIGTIERDDSLWSKVFVEMIKLVYIHPEMYTSIGTYKLQQSLDLIQNVLDLIIYTEIPLRFEAVPVQNVVPLTQDNLDRRVGRSTHTNTRVAPSVLHVASSAVEEDDPEAPTDNEAESILASRNQRIQRVGSESTAETVHGVMHVQIPDSRIGKRKTKRV